MISLLPTWFLIGAKTGESTKSPWVGMPGVYSVPLRTHGHFALSAVFACVQELKWRPVELNDRSL